MEVDKSLVPIFVETEIPKQIKQIGTGVFLDFLGEPFLFTAAHVTDDEKIGNLLVPTIYGFSEIDGYHARIDLLPEMSRKDDSVDMAYYRLSTRFARELCANFSPLVRKTEIIETSLNLNVISIVGYPASKGKKKGDVYSSELAYYRGVAADEETYSKCALQADESIIVQFNKKNAVSPLDGSKMNPPSPRGVSGGALFAWPEGHELSRDWTLPTLVGILHTYKEKEGLFIGTSILPYAAATALGKMKGYGGIR